MNKVVLVGRLVSDLDVHDFEEGKCVGRFTLAIPDGKDAKGEAVTQFISCVAWNKVADTIDQYAHKGDRLGVTGKMVQNIYKKDGVTHYNTDVLVDGFEFLEPKKTEEPIAEKIKEPMAVPQSNRRARR